MSLLNSLYVGIFGMSVVFVALVWLMFIVQIQSKIYNAVTKSDTKVKTNDVAPKIDDLKEEKSPSELELINVDEKTAATIIAIVSDESKIPPEQMDVKYIKAIDEI